MMITRAFLSAAALAASFSTALADPIPLDQLSAYLNGLTTAEATFTQINPDGSGSKGILKIRRPGRMRFEYVAPDQTVVLASAGHVAIFDSKSNQPPEQYPLSKTPLGLILGKDIDLAGARMVVGHSEEGRLTIVTAQDPNHPDYGTIALGFTANPIALRQWVVTDPAGAQTTVLLDPLKTGADYPTETFSIEAEVAKRGIK